MRMLRFMDLRGRLARGVRLPAPCARPRPVALIRARPLPLPPKPAASRQRRSRDPDSWWTNANRADSSGNSLPLIPPNLPLRGERQLPLLPLPEQVGELLSLEPAGEPESLLGIALQDLQLRRLALRLHSLCHRRHPQGAGEAQDGPHDLDVLLRGVDARDEGAVHLQG